jgi:hypothetical protein
MDRHMWPRYAYGRDGASIRGLVFLWDYTGKEDYRAMAREAMGRLIQCQRPDGGYGDQGSGTGIHGASHLPVKPWMANLANDCLIDYLERWPEKDPVIIQALIRYVDFLLRWGTHPDGTVYWPYQVLYHPNSHHDPWLEFRDPTTKGKLPTDRAFAHGHKARALNLMTRLTGNPRYFDAWLKFYDAHWRDHEPRSGDYHQVNKTLQHLPYAQAHAWNARWKDGQLWIAPVLSAYRPEMEGTIITPLGPVTLRVRLARAGKGQRGWELVDRRGDPRIRLRGSYGR